MDRELTGRVAKLWGRCNAQKPDCWSRRPLFGTLKEIREANSPTLASCQHSFFALQLQRGAQIFLNNRATGNLCGKICPLATPASDKVHHEIDDPKRMTIAGIGSMHAVGRQASPLDYIPRLQAIITNRFRYHSKEATNLGHLVHHLAQTSALAFLD